MILSPQADDTEAFETDESASTPPTSPYHIIIGHALPEFAASYFLHHHYHHQQNKLSISLHDVSHPYIYAITTNTTSVTDAQLKAMIDQGVTVALAARDADRSMNGDDSHNSGIGVKRTERVAREMETVFRISSLENQIKFATCTLLGIALMWWNSYIRTVGHDVAYAMTWTALKKKMTNKYCLRGVIKKLEELALMYVRMFPEESDKIERYVGGLPDMIHGSVMASTPKTMQDAIEMATKLMDKKINTLAERQVENKRKLDNNNQAQQQSPKRQDVAQAYAARTDERKEYAGKHPLCNKCKFHHNGPCTAKCANCKKVGHLTRDYWNPTATSNQRTITCYECGNQGHYKSDCPEQKNQNHENQTGGTGARGVVHALGGGETNQDLNNMEDEIEA
ncbi:RNA-directed DNA polymerase, eukaryota [Tanacetum coccineum]